MEIMFRSLIIFFVLFFITKLLGKKQMQHLTLFDYVIGITVGSLAADIIVNLDNSIFNGILALVIFGVIGYLFSYFSYQNHSAETLLDGEPLLLFYEDHFLNENLDRSKISVSKVLEQCRLKGCFDISQLQCVLLEPSGDFSILLKPSYQTCTTKEFKKEQIKKSYKQTLCHNIIVDGQIDTEELEQISKNQEWLSKELKKQNCTLEDVSLFYVNEYNHSSIIKKEKQD